MSTTSISLTRRQAHFLRDLKALVKKHMLTSSNEGVYDLRGSFSTAKKGELTGKHLEFDISSDYRSLTSSVSRKTTVASTRLI